MLLKTLNTITAARLPQTHVLSRLVLASGNCSQSPLDYVHGQRLGQVKSIRSAWSRMPLELRINFGFCFMPKFSPNQEFQMQKSQPESTYIMEESNKLIARIMQTSQITEERIKQAINSQVQKELLKYENAIKSRSSDPEVQTHLKSQQKARIHAQFTQNQEFMKSIEFNEHYRAMIMTRLYILWNEQYETMSIDQLTDMVKRLEKCKELKNNELKSMGMLFLAVEALRKCILTPRVNKNMICTTRSIRENMRYVQRCIEGQMQARENLQKVENLLSYLLEVIETTSSRYCFMKVQSQLEYLMQQIFKSFNSPDLYNDKSICLTSNPPRVVFDEPFHQEYDRFLQMAVLVLFNKQLNKQSKLSKLEHITHIFSQLKVYEEGKLQKVYEKHNCVVEIKRLKKKVNKMTKRVNIVQWIQGYVFKSVGK